MVKKLWISIYLFFKGLFGSKLEGVDSLPTEVGVPTELTQEQKKHLWDLYNKDSEDRINYTNTHHHHYNNFDHLDDVSHPDFNRIAEQVGLTYEEDGKTPKNPAAVFDMTYEQYEEYKKKILPHAKDRKITMEEIKELFD